MRFRGLGFLVLGLEPGPPIVPLWFALPSDGWHVSPASPGPQLAARLISRTVNDVLVLSLQHVIVQCVSYRLNNTTPLFLSFLRLSNSSRFVGSRSLQAASSPPPDL